MFRLFGIDSLIGWTLKQAAEITDAALEAYQQLVASTTPPRASVPWDGPDDLWPAEKPQITETFSQPELVVTPRWGLKFPSGEIIWNTWQQVSFDDPMGRVLMVAKLQKTALELGFAPEDFVRNYGWVTRNQIDRRVYEDTGAYCLTDPEVSAQVTPDQGLQKHDNESEDGTDGDPQPRVDTDCGVHRRSLGSDAQ